MPCILYVNFFENFLKILKFTQVCDLRIDVRLISLDILLGRLDNSLCIIYIHTLFLSHPPFPMMNQTEAAKTHITRYTLKICCVRLEQRFWLRCNLKLTMTQVFIFNLTDKKKDFQTRLCPWWGQDETAVYRHKSPSQWHCLTPHLSIQPSIASEMGNAGKQTLIQPHAYTVYTNISVITVVMIRLFFLSVSQWNSIT